jgi:hypothetical protein
MQKLKYNGWTNYETWNFKLWADNDEPTYKKVQSLIKEAPEIQASFYSDVMMASVREVNYDEVAKSLLED